MLSNHGAVCLGTDINDAFRIATVLEMTEQVYVSLYKHTKTYKESDIDFMDNFAHHHYGQEK